MVGPALVSSTNGNLFCTELRKTTTKGRRFIQREFKQNLGVNIQYTCRKTFIYFDYKKAFDVALKFNYLGPL